MVSVHTVTTREELCFYCDTGTVTSGREDQIDLFGRRCFCFAGPRRFARGPESQLLRIGSVYRRTV